MTDREHRALHVTARAILRAVRHVAHGRSAERVLEVAPADARQWVRTHPCLSWGSSPRSGARRKQGREVVRYPEGWARAGQVRWLVCAYCGWRVDVVALHRAGDRSGAGRYCRARARMVEHLHRMHREVLRMRSQGV